MKTLSDWYIEQTKGQLILMYTVSFCCILIYGIGLLCLAVLIYLELGKRKI